LTGRLIDCGILRSWLIRLRPEWESESYEKSDGNRMNTTTNWGASSVQGEGTLTDEERAAIEWCIFQQATPQRTAVILRKLLERTK
jgi:hypothetical protein